MRTAPSTVAALIAASAVLTSCGSSDSFSAEQCQDQTFFDENREACLDAVRDAIEADDSLNEDPAAGELELDPAECADQAFYDANIEFCANAGPIETETSVTEQPYVEWPDGLRAEISGVKAQKTDAYLSDQPDHDMEILVTVKLSNNGSEDVSLDSSYGGSLSDQLLYGENRYEAQGWMAMDNAKGSDTLPQRLVPGTSAEYVEVYSLPSAEAGLLAFSYSPDPVVYPSHMFTDVETLLG